MLRDVRVSPDGKTVVYSALGQLYRRALPDGKPRRLTKDAGFEFFPSFSRDGQWIVYVTWTDAEIGRVRVIRPDGSGGRDVVTSPVTTSSRRSRRTARRSSSGTPAAIRYARPVLRRGCRHLRRAGCGRRADAGA